MSNVSTKQSTKPPCGGNVEEPFVEKIKSFEVGKDVESAGFRGGSLKSVHSLGCEGRASQKEICKSVSANGPTATAVNKAVSSDGNRHVNPQEKTFLKDVDVTSTSSTDCLGQPKTTNPKVDFEDELDQFYKELEQIDPKDVDLPDDSCDVDKSTVSNRQTPPASDPEVQPEPHKKPRRQSDQQNESQNCGHMLHHSQYVNPSWPPPQEWSYGLPPSPGHDVKPQGHFHQWPFPTVPPPPHPLHDGPGDRSRGPNRGRSWLEKGPVESVHKYGDWASDGTYQRHNMFIPNEFHSFQTSRPVCFDPHGQAASSSCWSNSQEYQQHQQDQQYPSLIAHAVSLTLILMRGAPGSGKSTLARELLSSCPNGLILSTDDYFLQEDRYIYDPRLLGDAHCWNQSRTLKALCECHSPIIIDNTNMQAWEMKPYVQMALEKGYSVCFREPNTNWKYEPSELERRNKHGVPKEKIAKMLERFELPMTVDIVLRSEEPPHHRPDHAFKQQRKRRRDMSDFQ
ncbi:hypothetical protein ACEWY4_008577 [Coilia grayii]|uniref:NEDD4-binding protein 2-like 2 n=1 Tax=Coilia grayii TaxID=363190 RepID=A0ABD1KBG4_9TELE